jgi:glycosyltransferase involved in cell wall biosynthesis
LGGQVVLEKRPGYGQCYLTGFKAASGDILVTMDGDNSYPVKKIGRLIDVLIREELDFISGCRFPLKNKQAMAVLNRWGNYLLTLVFAVLTLKKIKDSQSGMWIFRREILTGMNLKSKGMSLSEEIKMEAVLNEDVKFKEVPISYAERAGRVKLKKFRDGLINLFFLFKKRIELMLK